MSVCQSLILSVLSPQQNCLLPDATCLTPLCCIRSHSIITSIFFIFQHFLFFFIKIIRYSFIQIDKVYRYNTNTNSLKTKRMNL